ncbi:hypothetical protein [Azospirillum sp. B506]|uniref:hypothetical protein n=1 Tax=Azospirillum sp. B506 TaxID=137721 RepID=UPI001B3B77D4|nr:hypothetical protein [Azospirillum sp. B506]
MDDFDRMVMASLCPSGALMLTLVPSDGTTADVNDPGVPDNGNGDASNGDGGGDIGLLPLGLGIASAILLASLAALA